MERALELIEQGQPGLITLLGMGGVFIALLCLYVFTSILGKSLSRKRSKRETAFRETEHPAFQSKPDTEKSKSPPSDEELAAAIALAYILETEKQRAAQVVQPPPFDEGVNPWKMAGRLALIRPFQSTGRGQR